MADKKVKGKEAFRCDPDFCPICGAILPLPGLEDVVWCKVCNFQEDTSEYEKLKIHSRIIFNEVNEKQTNTEAIDDSSGPTVDRKCSNCGHEGMTYQTRQTRSVDEGQTVFFNCPSCKHQESEFS